jgi:hypothetical protein
MCLEQVSGTEEDDELDEGIVRVRRQTDQTAKLLEGLVRDAKVMSPRGCPTGSLYKSQTIKNKSLLVLEARICVRSDNIDVVSQAFQESQDLMLSSGGRQGVSDNRLLSVNNHPVLLYASECFRGLGFRFQGPGSRKLATWRVEELMSEGLGFRILHMAS